MRSLTTDIVLPPLAIVLMLAAASNCYAQASPPTEPQAAQPPAASSPPANGEPLSKKLDRNDGVLKPPSGIDPKIHKEPPESTGDRMPVIIPPGEPGGDQSIQPK